MSLVVQVKLIWQLRLELWTFALLNRDPAEWVQYCLDIWLLELQERVPRHTRLLELLLLVLLVDPTVHPKAQRTGVEVQVDANRALCCRHEELMNCIVCSWIFRIACYSEF